MKRSAGKHVVHFSELWPPARNIGRGGLVTLLLLGLWLTLPPTPGAAHGGGTPQLSAAPAGPYRLFAWTTPEPWRVGEVHTTVAVTQPDADGRDVPISGAQVILVYRPVDAARQPIQVAAVEGSGAQVGFYEADTKLPSAGPWEVIIQVAGSAGSGEAAFAYSVLPAESGVNWWLVGLGLAGLALVAALLLAMQRSKRRGASGAQQPIGSL